MRRKRSIGLFVLPILITLWAFSGASFAYTLSLETYALDDQVTQDTEFEEGEAFYVDIVLDDPTMVAGCAFTLTYDQAFFTAPTTSAEGVSSEIWGTFPFTFVQGEVTTDTHRENNQVGEGKILFSGAAINEVTGGGKYGSVGEVTLFRVKFLVNPGIAGGSTSISLVQTELLNEAAGWGSGTTPEPVPLLTGAVAQGGDGFDNFDCSSPPCAFPVLLESLPAPVTASVDIVACVDGDADGLCDRYETNTGTFISPTDAGTDPANPDTDGDGMIDGWEVDNLLNPVLNDASEDSDGDGSTNLEEYECESDPNDPNSSCRRYLPFLNILLLGDEQPQE